jgi:hypothetical protein
MGTSWCGFFKLGGDGEREFVKIIELQPKEDVHNKMVSMHVATFRSARLSFLLKRILCLL